MHGKLGPNRPALARVREGGGRVAGDVDECDYGMFGWFVDPERNKVELWEPKEAR